MVNDRGMEKMECENKVMNGAIKALVNEKGPRVYEGCTKVC